MQTVIRINDHRLFGNIDAFLGTNRVTQSAADAALAHKISPRLYLHFPNDEGIPGYMRRIADIKILPLCLVDLKHLQGSFRISRVNFLHISILKKNFVKFLGADIPDFSPQ